MIHLTKLYDFIKGHYIAATIILLGFFVRWYGIYFDYPGTGYIWDEIYNISHLLEILDKKTIFLSWTPSPYPFFLPFLYIPVLGLRIIYLVLLNGITSLSGIKNYFIMEGMGQLFIVSRWYSVIFGTMTVYLVYRIYSYAFKEKASSYYAALVYSVSLVPVFLSHWGKVHSAMVFFFMLSLLYSLKYEEHKKNKFLYFSVICSAFSVSTHYIGISSVIFPLYAIFKNKKIITTKAATISLGVFTSITAFFYLANYNGVLRILVDMKRYYDSTGYTSILPIGRWERFYYIIRDYFYLDPVFSIVFLIMLVLLIRAQLKNNFTKYILIGLFFNYLLMISIIAAPKMSRWLLIFVSLSVPLGAGSLIDFLKEKKINNLVIAAVGGLLILPTFFVTWHWLNLLDHNTYMETKKWLENDIGHRAVVYTFDPLVYAAPSYETARHEKEVNYNLVSKKYEYILQNKDAFEGKGVRLLNDKRSNRFKELGGPDTKYVIVNNESVVKEIEKYHAVRPVRIFMQTDEPEHLEKGISGDYLNSPENFWDLLTLDKSGPNILIYEIMDNENK